MRQVEPTDNAASDASLRDEPKVSFVVIARNERLSAPKCLQSIFAQDVDVPFEIVFVDDGSTDGTADVAAEFAVGRPEFRLLREARNLGRGAARQDGMNAARAPLIAFVDSDITLPRDWLRRCLSELPGNAAVGGVPVPNGDIAVVARISRARPRVVPGSMPITGSNVLFDRAAFAELAFDPGNRLGEDFRLAAKLLRRGDRLARVPDLAVEHEETRSYGDAIRWRFENGVDASTHPVELGMVRLPDFVWAGWCLAWVVGVAGALSASIWWLLLGPMATAGAGVAHVASRFHARPIGPYLRAAVLNILPMGAYLLGRTIGAPRLLARLLKKLQ